ncbi:protein translocase, putative [Cordyceps militaris CM01]|uniref:Protein translocase, putative n=1 Tax=Cordyceps militaris (strain CM01) TaxID=983644 RepID=G3JLN4_CORMM|nr:protein translocase, putative [Cordyceps militaris CM01]EGX90608.1 protein translocase, putative [Cordyceps militaris CM01]
MADHVENLIDVPKEFIREGIQFMNKCQKRELRTLRPVPDVCERAGQLARGTSARIGAAEIEACCREMRCHNQRQRQRRTLEALRDSSDRKEFIKISQAIAMGFVAMGTVGYLVKLIHIPINNILVAGA